MLRVCPVISTPCPQAYAETLVAAGLRREAGPDAEPAAGLDAGATARQLFDSGNGKIAVEYAPAHAIRLEFELRDAAIFVQRTLADGTHAALLGGAAQVAAGDFTFLARPATDLSLPDPEGGLSVTAIWTTENPTRANTVLANIGAKKLHDLPGGGALFRAKNGGFVRTAAGAVPGVGLHVERGGTGTILQGMPDGGSLAIPAG